MSEQLQLSELPEELRPIKPAQWKEACEWIRMRWGRTAWEDDIILYNDAQFWCEDELWGGMQYCFEKGSEFPPNFTELNKQVMAYRSSVLVHKLEKLKGELKELPAQKGTLRDYLQSIGAESFAHACYLATQKRAKVGRLEVYEDETSFDNWTMPWEQAKETYLVRLGNFPSNEESSGGG